VSRPPNIIFIGKKPIMTYVNATLTLLSNEPIVTIKARGKSITTAVDVSQMIVKRLNAVGYKVSGVRIFSERMTSQDGKERNVSTVEVDISRP
jgi:DNA-binding protein Alba